MTYWRAKSDLAFMEQFRDDVHTLWAKEDEYENWRPPSLHSLVEPPDVEDDPEYQEVRKRIAQAITRAVRIGARLRVPIGLTSSPPPAIGGVIIQTNLFEVILRDNTYRKIPRQDIIDGLNRTVGACEDDVRAQRRHALNPAWWLWSALVFVLRIPFILLSAAGFDMAKFEDELWAKLLKAGEVILILYFAARWGFRADIVP